MSMQHVRRQGQVGNRVRNDTGAEAPGPKQTPAKDMLFNLVTDVGEQRDLATEYPERLMALRKLYQTWSDDVDADCRKLGIEPPMPK